MPAVSKAQRQAMAIAKHHPEKLHDKNKGLLRMSDEELEEYASTPERGLPQKKKLRRKAKAKKPSWSDKIK